MDNSLNQVANNNKVQTWKCLNNVNQEWAQYSDGTIRYKGNTNYCLDVNKNGTANDTPVDLFTCNGGENQKWTLTKITSGTNNGKTELVGNQSGKCLDINQRSTANGTPLEIYQCNNAENQVWSWESGAASIAKVTWAYLSPTGLKETHTTNQIKLSWNTVTDSNPSIPGGVPAPTSYTVAVYRNGSLIRSNSPTTTSFTENGLDKGGTVVVNVWANGGPIAPSHASVTVVLTK